MTIPQRSWLTLNMTSDQPDPNGRWPRELDVFLATSNVLKCCNSYWCNFYDGTLGMTNPPKTTGYVLFYGFYGCFVAWTSTGKKKKTLAPQCSTKDWVQTSTDFQHMTLPRPLSFYSRKILSLTHRQEAAWIMWQELKHHFGWRWLHACFFPATLCLKHPELQNIETKSSRHSKKISSHKSNCLCCFSLPFGSVFGWKKKTGILSQKSLAPGFFLGCCTFTVRRRIEGHRREAWKRSPKSWVFCVTGN